MSKSRPVVLAILDGFGIWREKRGNPVLAAKTPTLEFFSRNFPGVPLQASGVEVGLSWGEMGNSEVGHINIGAGLIVYQSLSRIQFAIQDGSLLKLKIWDEMIAHAEKNKSSIQLMGLVSNGGIHSHIDHLLEILNILAIKKVSRPVYIHVFTDGQDVSPKSAEIFLNMLEKKMQETKIAKIATMMGRYYAMDKSQKLDLTEKAFICLTEGKCEIKAKTPKEVADKHYKKNLGDEFFEPTLLDDKGVIQENDAVFFFNFRADRARQISEMFLKKNYKKMLFVTMTEYNKDYPFKIAVSLQEIKNPLAKVISDAGKKQFHVAETEKYAHITYFLNGGTEKPFPGEDRVIVPSPKMDAFGYVKTPEMSSYKITEELIKAIESEKYPFLAVNFAATDILGHSGNFEAAIQAIQAVDECLGKIWAVLEKLNGALMITSDHGNCEEMINLATGKVDTEHSTNPVPCWMIFADLKLKKSAEPSLEPIVPNGILADVAPTVLELIGIDRAKEMTGRSLLGEIKPLVLK